MRFAARALMGALLVVCLSQVVAAESASSWWPFGSHEKTIGSPAPAAASSSARVSPRENGALRGSRPIETGPIAHDVQLPQEPPAESTKAKSSWLGLHMPKIPKPHLPTTGASQHKSKTAASRNKWVDKPPAPPRVSPLQSVKNGAHSVAAGTKAAWHKTIAAVTPGNKSDHNSNNGSQIARREVKPPFWKRMLGAKEPQLQGPQTIPEWMAQKRLDP